MKDTVSEGMMTVIVIALAALVLAGGSWLWDNVIKQKIQDEIDQVGYVEVIDDIRI